MSSPLSRSPKANRNLRDFMAVVLILAALALGPAGMFFGEAKVDPKAAGGFESMLHGMMTYCNAFGILLFLAGMAFLLIGYQDKVSTSLTRPNDDD